MDNEEEVWLSDAEVRHYKRDLNVSEEEFALMSGEEEKAFWNRKEEMKKKRIAEEEEYIRKKREETDFFIDKYSAVVDFILEDRYSDISKAIIEVLTAVEIPEFRYVTDEQEKRFNDLDDKIFKIY